MLKNIASNWLLSVLQILLLLILTPFVKDELGDAGFGMWETIVSVAMPFQLLALGLPMATVRAVSKAIGEEDHVAANRVIGTALTMTLLLGVIAACLSALFFPVIVGGLFADSEWIQEGPAHPADVRWALGLMMGSVAASFVLRLPYAIFDAHKDFIPRNMIMATGFITRLVATLVLVQWRATLPVLASIQAAVFVLEFVLASLVSRRLHPQIRFRISGVSRGEARSLLSFSVFAFLLNMGALLAFRIDNVVIKAHLSELDVTVYTLGAKIFDPMITLLLGIGSVIMPVAATAAARGNLADVRPSFLRWSRIAALISLVMGSYILALGPQFLRTWVDAGDTSGRIVQVLMASFLLFLPIRSVALPVLMGLGQARAAGFGLLGMGVANLVLSLALIGQFGVMGVAFGTAIPNVVFSIYLANVACRALDIPFIEWASYTFGKPTVAALATGGALYYATSLVEMDGFARLLPAGVIHTVLFGVLTWAWVLREDLRVRL